MEFPPVSGPTIESIAESENLHCAWEHVRANKGAAGVDGVDIPAYGFRWNNRLPMLQSELLDGSFRPHPLRSLSVPKTSGGFRTLGIPTVEDRVVLQALALQIAPRWEPTFSPNSFGYRPGRSAHDAVAMARRFLENGRRWVVDLDIKAFFGRVDHVRLMLRLAERIPDARVLDLIADFLRVAAQTPEGVLKPTIQGIPQGSPLSPLLANIVLDELDQKYSALGWPFVRYADDFIVLARSEQEGRAMLAYTENFLAERLRLSLHLEKSRIVSPAETAFLGFTYRVSRYGRVRCEINSAALESFRRKFSEIIRPRHGQKIEDLARQAGVFVRGWTSYYAFGEPRRIAALNGFARARLRACAWEIWRTPEERRRQLIERGVAETEAESAACALILPDQLSDLPVLSKAFPNAWFEQFSLGANNRRGKVPGSFDDSSSGPNWKALREFILDGGFRRDLQKIACSLPPAHDAMVALARLYEQFQEAVGRDSLADIRELQPIRPPLLTASEIPAALL